MDEALGSTPPRGAWPANLKNRLLVSLVFALLVVAGLAFFADLPKTLAALGRFDWRLLPLALLFVLWNYALRFAKWHYYLSRIEVRSLPLLDSALIFLSGLSMVVTPGRVGEWLKSYLLREVTRTPLSVSAPIVVAERLTDAISMLFLTSLGLVAFSYGWQMLLTVFLGAAVLVYLTQHRAAARLLFRLVRPLPGVGRRLGQLRAFYDSSNRLFRPRSLALAVGLGIVSWFGECVAFAVVLAGLGLAADPLLVLQATFILATATIVGSVSMLPGGLAAAEGSLAGLLLVLGVTADAAVAAAATLLVRLCTLWFGVVVGLLALVVFSRRLGHRRPA